MYLEPKDSLLIRLNTWNFDETLVFSGRGAEKNNLLIDSFLQSEQDEKLFYAHYNLPSSEFLMKVDSTEKIRLETYNNFVTNNPNQSELYKNILKIALTYPLYTKLENYPMAHSAKMNDRKQQKINPNFYKHRDLISLNKDTLMFFYPYREYLVSNLYNKANNISHDISSDDFTNSLLKTISLELKNENSRNSMLRQTIISHFIRKSSCEINKNTFSTFLNLSSSVKDKKLVELLINDINKIKKGSFLSDFSVTDFNQTKRSLKSLTKNKNTVLYFWNPDYLSNEYIGSRITYLSKKYPSLHFIGVKIIGSKIDKIRRLDIKNQFYLENDSEANMFLTSKIPRTILINSKGSVTNGFASLSSNKIFQQLERLAKK